MDNDKKLICEFVSIVLFATSHKNKKAAPEETTQNIKFSPRMDMAMVIGILIKVR